MQARSKATSGGWLTFAVTKGFIFAWAIALVACGADSSAYNPTRDTIRSEAKSHFEPEAKLIVIDAAGPAVQSTFLSPCEISFEVQELSYNLLSDTRLELNGNAYTFSRQFETPETLASVNAKIFAVWAGEAQIIGGVSNQIEIEIHPSSLVYLNNCSR